MNQTKIEHEVVLQEGYIDNKGNTHRRIVFGKRLTGADLFDIDTDRQSQSPTQYSDLVRRRAITKFGDMKVLPPLEALIGLSRIDRSILADGYEDFVRLGRGNRKSEMKGAGVVRLFFGFQIDDVAYPIVYLDRPTTGRDELEADSLALYGLSRLCFLIGKSISRITSEDGSLSISGPIGLEAFRALDGDDISTLQEGDRLTQAFFRITGSEVPEERASADATPVDEGDGANGKGVNGSPETEI